jgi:exopolysaccharide production protein ExoZ
MKPAATDYRNIQGLRAIAALMVFASHMFWDIVPMRTHWARPYAVPIGLSGVDIFFVISGFIIYHVAKRSKAQVNGMGRGRAVYEFAMKRIIRIYPLYWIVFGVAAFVMTVAGSSSIMKKPLFELLFLFDSIPNFRVQAAWTLTFEVYFYAVTALSIFLFPKRIFAGLLMWFAVIGCANVLASAFGLSIPLNYVFSPILLEFFLGIAVGVLIERGETRFYGTSICIGVVWILIGSWYLQYTGGHAVQSYLWRLGCWGLPAALVVYGVVALEARNAWIMPSIFQYLGNASYSIYLWHAVMFMAVAALFEYLGWVGVVNRCLLAVLMGIIGLGTGLLSYHFLEKPSLRFLGKCFIGQSVSSHAMRSESFPDRPTLRE